MSLTQSLCLTNKTPLAFASGGLPKKQGKIHTKHLDRNRQKPISLTIEHVYRPKKNEDLFSRQFNHIAKGGFKIGLPMEKRNKEDEKIEMGGKEFLWLAKEADKAGKRYVKNAASGNHLLATIHGTDAFSKTLVVGIIGIKIILDWFCSCFESSNS